MSWNLPGTPVANSTRCPPVNQQKELSSFTTLTAILTNAFPLLEMDGNGKVLSANRLYLDNRGLAHSTQLEGSDWFASSKDTLQGLDRETIWNSLKAGSTYTCDHRRENSSGPPVCWQSTLHPTLNETGELTQVIEVVTDWSATDNDSGYSNARLEAFSRSQAVIEFKNDGTIVDANENFLAAVGYTLEEIQGKHHRMFCDREYADSNLSLIHI